MKKYTGTKEILAVPMGSIEFTQYMGFESEAMDSKEGYLVEYLDSSNGNHPSRSNYVSWLPKDVFERAYSPPDTPLERAVAERAELLEKIDRLDDFISSDKFVDLGEEHGKLMRGQLVTMEEYAEFLNWRIELMQSDNLDRIAEIKELLDTPLTTGELKAGGWWCAEDSKESWGVLEANGLSAHTSWSSFASIKNLGIVGFSGEKELCEFKQIHRRGNNFYWGAPSDQAN